MSSQCPLPCLTPADSCPSHPVMTDPAACPVQDVHPCPEQTSQAEPCLCQGVATCPDACPQVGATHPPPVVPIPGAACCPEQAAARGSCTAACGGVCVCPAAIPCDPPQSKGGTNFPFQPTAVPVELYTPETCVDTSVQQPTSAADPCTLETAGTCAKTFPLQHIIPTVELCLPDTAGPCVETLSPQQAIKVEPCTSKTVGTCMESVALQYPTSSMEPCTLEVVEICTEEPCCAQGVIAGDPCPDQCLVTSMDPCSSPSMVCTEQCVTQTPAEPMETCTPLSTVELGTAQGTTGPTDSSAKDTAKGCPSPRAHFCLNTRTAAIVERCLSRCQNWLRGKK